jgi:hypothetical protein
VMAWCCESVLSDYPFRSFFRRFAQYAFILSA